MPFKKLPSGIGLEPVKPEDALEYFGSKLIISKAEFIALDEEVRTLAFTVARVTKMEMIKDSYNLVDKAIEQGISAGEFKKQFNALFDAKGWEELEPWHTDLIFRQNAQTAYSVGRYEQIQSGGSNAFPWWGFSVVGVGSTPVCMQLLDKVYPANHPIFNKLYPPNHFNCRTSVFPISKYDNPGPVSDEIPPIPADEGFGVNPAVMPYEPDLSQFPKKIQDFFEADQQE